MDIATMGALATKLTDFSVNFLQGVFCESFCEVLDLGKDIVFEAIRTGKINQETAKALEEVDKEVLDNLKAFIGQELKSKKGKIPTKLRGKDLTELFTGRLETVSEMVEKYAIQHNLSEANKLALTYVLGEIKRVTAQAAHKTMGGDEKRLVLVLSQVMENVYSNTKDEITSLLIQTVYTRPVECYNCGNEDLHYDDRMQMASCSHCGRKTAYSKNEGLMNGVQRDLNDFRAKVEQYQQTILAGLAALSQQLDEHDKKNSEEHIDQNKKLDAIQQDVQQVLKNQQSQPQGNAGAQPTTVIAPAPDAQSRQIRDIRVLLDLDRNIEEAEARLRPLLKATPSNGELRWLSLRIKSFDFTDLSKLTTKEINGANKCLRDDGQIPENNPEYQLYVKACEAEEARKAEEANVRQFTFETKTENGKTYSILTGVVKLNSDDVVIPKYDLKGNPVTGIEERAFESCYGLKSIAIPNGITSIGESAFKFCEHLTSVDIPDSVTDIGASAFIHCERLKAIEIPGAASIGEFAFYECKELKNIQIPCVTSIGNNAFSGCAKLTSLNIPNSVSRIGDGAFSACTRLTRITVDSHNHVYHSIRNCLIETETNMLHTGCQNSTIPSNVTSIGNDAFCGCTGLTSIDIPNSVKRIGDGAFGDCSSLTSITIPNSVTSIESGAFAGCTGLTSITIPNSVKRIEFLAFAECTGLTSITIPNSVTSIEEGAFYECTGLTSITISNSVTSIEEGTFYGCTSLTSITIPNSVKSIENWAFAECTSLTSITIPNSVESIGNGASDRFTRFLMLSTICSSSIFTTRGAFRGCTGLTSITIPNSVKSIGKGSFIDCIGLTRVTIPDSVTSIEENIFYGCEGLTSITLPNSVKSIGNCAFAGCTSLTSITIPNSVTSIEDSAFAGCTGLTSITLPNSVKSIGNWAFDECDSLKDVYYTGSRKKWDALEIDEGDELAQANIHYNWKGK